VIGDIILPKPHFSLQLPYIIFPTIFNGKFRMAKPSGPQGQPGTDAFFGSFSMAFTRALQPVSVSTRKGCSLPSR